MNISDFAKAFPEKIDKLKEFVQGNDIRDIAGVEAVKHFKQSFDNEGFTDERLDPWKDVKRRAPDSPWYGHSGQTGKFSAERTSAPILTGETKELRNATRYVHTPTGVRVLNEKPYARIHQEGGTAYIYGKKPFLMTPRPFIGPSKVMMQKIKDKISRQLIKIITEP